MRPTILASADRVAPLVVVALDGARDAVLLDHLASQCEHGLEAGNVWLILRRVDDAVDDESMLFDVRAPSLAPLRVEDSPRGLQAPGAERMPGQSAARIVMATSRRERSAFMRRPSNCMEIGSRNGSSSGQWH